MSRKRSRFAVFAAVVAVFAASAIAGRASTDPFVDGTRQLACTGTDDRLESTQGRTPLADYSNGKAAAGYRCNATQVGSTVGADDGFTGGHGGYRVYRYVDEANPPHTCAFYDTTLLFPVNAAAGGANLTGVWVLDMTDPEHPVHTASLLTPAMQSPHESFSFNESRGLLGAVFANPAFYHGQFDLYSVKDDCTNPKLLSSLPTGVLGHEGSFTPDGNTYYASSLYGHTLTAIDTSDPLGITKILWSSPKWNVHGMNISDNGKTLYFADVARNNGDALGDLAGSATKGLTVLNVEEIQERKLNPQVTTLSHITWPHVGTPQTAIPVTISGHKYLVEIDEFGGTDNVGAARIIDIQTPDGVPAVVSNMRLAVNNKAQQESADQKADPAASNSLGGYRGHYCGVPREVDPGIVACTFILSGLRVFDIHNPADPVEIAYFNKPSVATGLGTTGYGPQGAYAMSQPAFDVARHDVWYSDGNSGFYNVHISADVAW